MTINAQSENGKIRLFEDFTGGEDIVAETAASRKFGDFRVIGQGIAETDSGITVGESDPALSGVGVLTTTDETEHTCGITTAKMWRVSLMAPLVAECRVQFTDLDTKQFYFGFTDVNDDTAILEGGNLLGSTTTITLTASDLCGFLLSAELTDDEDWHMVYNGGATTGETTSTSIDADDDAVAGEWQLLRIEVDPNGDARWYIDGVLKQSVTGAVSTSTYLACMAMVEAKGNAVEIVNLDYLMVSGNRDWNA